MPSPFRMVLGRPVRARCALLIVAMSIATASASAAPGTPRMLTVHFRAGDISGRWWGLCEDHGRFRLAPVTASYQPTVVRQADGGAVESPPIAVHGCHVTPSVLLRNLPFLARRPVPSATVKPGPGVDSSSHTAELAGETLRLESEELEHGARCVLRAGERSQTLNTTTDNDASLCDVLWAGDLDGDGHLDLLVEMYRDGTPVVALFLSRRATDGELVHLVVTALTDPT